MCLNVHCCDIRYDFRTKRCPVSSLSQVVCRMSRAHVLYLRYLCFVFVLLFFVLCTLCCQFLWIFDCPFGVLLRLFTPFNKICYFFFID